MPVTIPGLPDAPANARVNGGPSSVEFFDFFFSDNGGMPAQNFNTFLQWNVTGGSVDFVGGVGPGVFGAPPDQDTGRYVDLGGSTGDPGRFETRAAFLVTAGDLFNLTFDYRSTGGDFNTAVVTMGDRSWTVSTDKTSFRRFSEDFVATTTGLVTIAFQGDESDTDGSGIGVDGILFGRVLDPSEDETLVASPNPNHLEGRGGDDTLIGSMFDDVLRGGTGTDVLTGSAGDDRLIGGRGDDTLDGGLGIDLADYRDATEGVRVNLATGNTQGGASGDTLTMVEDLFGTDFRDVLKGDAMANTLTGGGGVDHLAGAAGDDRLLGGAGNDRFIGGTGVDAMAGGDGADRFSFLSLDDSTIATPDRILDFDVDGGDRIGLRRIDAAPEAGNQRFDFIGEDAFGGTAGELRVDYSRGGALVSGDVDGDAIADFAILIDGVSAQTPLTAGDFVL